jgi:hypothetical protein
MLHVVYRSYGGENLKGRPAYYTKRLALGSFVRSVERARKAGVAVEVVYLNNGAIPEDRLCVMQRTGEVIQCNVPGNVDSFRLQLALPVERAWPEEALVWLSEDDYFYLPTALSNLAAAAAKLTDADYFALYASIGYRPPEGGTLPDYAPLPSDWLHGEPVRVQDKVWQRGLSTTATFGGRVRALREDRWLFEGAMLTGTPWDHTMCLLYQGFQPFPWPDLKRRVRAASLIGPKKLARESAIAMIRAGANLTQQLRCGVLGARARTLMAAHPALITHMESGHLAEGTDWEREAHSHELRAYHDESQPPARRLDAKLPGLASFREESFDSAWEHDRPSYA